eukprot:CAMPEP_0179089162 /NCGR_PEP_ID=MMETSP0796-20121207/40608_1 /TAXON_ID=73915 /ORGANISM="Pyrodinium bahamense, Strain pbaha01" /LENGTH=249 /DNA_ID=CAMNT_0020786705 /DNA_START=47 /DNA_END=792 /DNA_ORIENTATION=-
MPAIGPPFAQLRVAGDNLASSTAPVTAAAAAAAARWSAGAAAPLPIAATTAAAASVAAAAVAAPPPSSATTRAAAAAARAEHPRPLAHGCWRAPWAPRRGAGAALPGGGAPAAVVAGALPLLALALLLARWAPGTVAGTAPAFTASAVTATILCLGHRQRRALELVTVHLPDGLHAIPLLEEAHERKATLPVRELGPRNEDVANLPKLAKDVLQVGGVPFRWRSPADVDLQREHALDLRGPALRHGGGG